MKIPEIDFGRLLYNEYEGNSAYVMSIDNVETDNYFCYGEKLKEIGYAFKESHMFGVNSFSTYTSGNDAIYLAYYPNIKEMRIVTEEDSAYLSFADESGASCTSSLVTQIDLEDFGLSYTVRLTDGRFIIFDGGWQFEPDADSLMRVLEEQ